MMNWKLLSLISKCEQRTPSAVLVGFVAQFGGININSITQRCQETNCLGEGGLIILLFPSW